MSEERYPNLCALCEHPEQCDYPDKYSGYDGALRCLAENGGEVAWTKVYYVKKHFGLPIGAGEAVPTGEDPDNYAFLCPDGTKKPITGRPCIWAARPWQGYITNTDVEDMSELRSQISLADNIGETEHAAWLSKVLDLNNKTVAVDNGGPFSPQQYLDKANYTDVIERDTGDPHRPVRFCVTSDTELEKCHVLRRAAFSRDIRPAFDCVQESTNQDCMATVRDNGADVITLDGGDVFTAMREYNLKPIIAEQYGEHGSMYYAVAVVKKSSSYQSIADLRGAKSCHTGYGRTAGEYGSPFLILRWNVPLYLLLNQSLISRTSCPYSEAVSTFFSGGSCVPGVPHGPELLCSLCAGNLDTGDRTYACSASNNESFFGYTGAFRCLASGAGDVAFVKHTTVAENTEGRTVTKELYVETLRRLWDAVRRKRPEKWVENNWFLMHDNAPAHRAIIVKNFLARHNITALDHPPYSPDLSPPDYFLFPRLKSHPKGRRFNAEEVIANATRALRRVSQNGFQACFQELYTRWQKCVVAEGNYFEGNAVE
ncbi:hypothetical protein ANN_27090 [Periplaneta americana]|uniref:Transferrin-like domain-containing protein n=1 Tax=Periplaneta americana TaxID=6978 RepID=A0ABQ8RX66_PERAM|nr:hypothetical protein ANN_27090 [Periplaneta americana]